MKKFWNFIDKISGSVKWFGTAVAVFAAGYSSICSPDMHLFLSNYAAGALGATAVAMWLEEEDDP